ncbi:unnamed protein product [Notodromas monacha]|uniref:MD-2-related lipid-recognition domain-containing protein n=1 Tax=Notodromas monacha TaxID=399045 RepID=A0A7R9GHL3_9CRUS|nr:unnamed protein product [Notodromas monacha]CAG0920913.1 unnamed protein product [Notodromas monacha]
MKFLHVLSIALATLMIECSASQMHFKIPPLKSGHKIDRVEISSCSGPDAILQMNSAALSPSPIEYPGSVVIAMDINTLQDIPEHMEISLDLTLLDPFEIPVPCLGGLGSCSYKACDLVTTMPEVFCELLPVDENGVCSCPIKAGHYVSEGLVFVLPDLGDLFALLLQGRYDGEIQFHAGGNKSEQYGCMGMSFEIIKPE